MIDIEAARQLLDFGRRIGEGSRAEEQLRGAVAIHNMLATRKVAYLADEVGMGKTYVALGALALFRHFNPNFRVLVITPRENIQRKWQKELGNFIAHNVRVDDLRNRAPDGRPVRSMVSCNNLVELAREASLDPDRDFFVRMTSFSLALGQNSDEWKQTRDGIKRHLPWLRDDAFDLRRKDEFKRNLACALNCALPTFDLVIVDEAHNFKHGLASSGSARNQVLASVLGNSKRDGVPDKRTFPNYGLRASKLLLLSATPLEESYRHIWNQLDLFGFAEEYELLQGNDDALAEQQKELASRFLVRRVNSIRIADREHTKNMYRREWREGGVETFDKPLAVRDERQKLVVALVQKKVSELLSGSQFKRSFQIGMLASFESFLQTAKLRREVDDESSLFDDGDQTDNAIEREGLDVHDINRLSAHYRQTFGQEMPHPKMDAVVLRLAQAWRSGRKALVFVRRVASVKELKRKLDESYDAWLIDRLRTTLPRGFLPDFEQRVLDYDHLRRREATRSTHSLVTESSKSDIDTPEDPGGNDTFFAWYFRGKGPPGIASGAYVRRRMNQSNGAYATFFSQNHVMGLLEAESGRVFQALVSTLQLPDDVVDHRLRQLAARYLSRDAKVTTRGARMEAVQAAALELLRESGGELGARAGVLWHECYSGSLAQAPMEDSPPGLASALEQVTFFTEICRSEWNALRARVWPLQFPADESIESFRAALRIGTLRGEMLASAARLGHAFVDLYGVVVSDRSALALGSNEFQEAEVDEPIQGRAGDRAIHTYLRLLEEQRLASEGSQWGAFKELADISESFELILDVNLPEARTARLNESTRLIAGLLREQQPTGGMDGRVNKTLVRQFRMPGYPLVLVTTDILQEGEDLHTFCSEIHHYGISWTPSSMEQRIGRIDRVRSQTDRRLTVLTREPEDQDCLQVLFPHLADTVEVLQVRRVLDRMGKFMLLMHEGLQLPKAEDRRIDVGQELTMAIQAATFSREQLRSAFPLPVELLTGATTSLAVAAGLGQEMATRFRALRGQALGGLDIAWEVHAPSCALLGTARLPRGRIQPFTLLLQAAEGHPIVHCVSPIGRTQPATDTQRIAMRACNQSSRLCVVPTKLARSYDLTIEDDVDLGDEPDDAERVGLLLRRVLEQADAMEQSHFDGRRDAPLQDFDADLREEAADGH